MERLTLVPNDGRDAGLRGYCSEQDAINRLASYEDIGLEPQTISEILDSVSEWYDAHKEGRLLVLPCKVGTPIYWINFNQHDGYWIELGEFHLQDIGVFGKTVFRTREEAEAKLKERGE